MNCEKCYFCDAELNRWGECDEHPDNIVDQRGKQFLRELQSSCRKSWLRYQSSC